MSFSGMIDNLIGILSYFPPLIFVMGSIIFFHELGHFCVARWFDVKIKVFSIGFGPEICGWYDKHGTRWRISLIPLGGYVSFMSDCDIAAVRDSVKLSDGAGRNDSEGDFLLQPLYVRAVIVAAGPLASLMLSVVLFTSMVFFVGERSLIGNGSISASISEVVDNSSAADAGFQSGDMILSVDGKPVDNFKHFQTIIQNGPFAPLTVGIERGGQKLLLHVTPRRGEVRDQFGNKKWMPVLGVMHKLQDDEYQLIRYSLPRSFVIGVQRTWFITERILETLGNLVIGERSMEVLGGPLRIASVSKHASEVGFVSLVNLAALLSVSVGILNLLPLPLLDGGYLVFYAIEKIRGYPLSQHVQSWCCQMGFVFLICLAIFITWNDLFSLKIFGN